MQGVAEVLPVSSSAQLTLLPWLAGRPPATDRTALAAALHAGSCVGVGVALRTDLRALDRRTAVTLAATTVPAALAGLVAGDVVERRLGAPGPTAALLAGAGAAMWAADRRPQDRPLSGKAAAAAALAQVVALAPGVSRSGATLTALRLLRVDRTEAQRFSLLMSLPVTSGAAALTVVRRGVPGEAVVGVPVAAAAAAATTILVRRSGVSVVSGAALYRVALAAAVAVRLAQRKRLS